MKTEMKGKRNATRGSGGKSLERLEQMNKKSEGGIRSKKKFEFTRKRSRENIQEEEEGLELRK